MFLGKKKKLEDHILEELQKGPKLILDLIFEMKKRNSGTTKQGVYHAIRQLKEQEAVVTQKGVASVNTAWLNRVNQYALVAQQHYLGAKQRSGEVAGLQEGEKIKYYFNDSVSTDVFWNHTIGILSSIVDPSYPFFAFDPHCWFYYSSENEATLRNNLVESGRQYLISVNGKTALDKYIQKEFDGTASQYYMAGEKMFTKENYYFNLLGDYVIEVWLDPETERRIDNLYRSTKRYSEAARTELQDIVAERGKTRLVVSRNKNKAERLRKKLIKKFYVPSGV